MDTMALVLSPVLTARQCNCYNGRAGAHVSARK